MYLYFLPYTVMHLSLHLSRKHRIVTLKCRVLDVIKKQVYAEDTCFNSIYPEPSASTTPVLSVSLERSFFSLRIPLGGTLILPVFFGYRKKYFFLGNKSEPVQGPISNHCTKIVAVQYHFLLHDADAAAVLAVEAVVSVADDDVQIVLLVLKR